jgi:hypothetical protein
MKANSFLSRECAYLSWKYTYKGVGIMLKANYHMRSNDFR